MASSTSPVTDRSDDPCVLVATGSGALQAEPDADAEALPGDEPISDEELEALALAADPNETAGIDAVPFFATPAYGAHLLSSWYMPAVAMRRSSGWHKPVVIAIVATLVVLEALGLCSVFGQVVVG